MKADQLVDRLRETGRSNGIPTDAALARTIGITHSGLVHIAIGRRKPGLLFLRGVLRAFPNLEPDVVEYIRDCH